MAGLLGSLAMLLEYRGLGVTVDLDAVPRPAGLPLTRWLNCFPCYAFLLCVPPGSESACAQAFAARDLAAAPVGSLDGTGQVRVRAGQDAATVFDLSAQPVTGLPTGSNR